MVVLSFYGTFLEREFGIYSKFGLGTFRNLRINTLNPNPNINARRKPVSCRGVIQELTVIQC